MSWKVLFCAFQSTKSGKANGYFPGADSVSFSRTNWLGLRYGSGRSRMVSMMLKIAVLAPMPMASVRAATRANPRAFPKFRNAYRKSCKKVAIL